MSDVEYWIDTHLWELGLSPPARAWQNKEMKNAVGIDWKNTDPDNSKWIRDGPGLNDCIEAPVAGIYYERKAPHNRMQLEMKDGPG